jgi:hypothetical protein
LHFSAINIRDLLELFTWLQIIASRVEKMKVMPCQFRGAIILQNQNYFCESDATPSSRLLNCGDRRGDDGTYS